jgi:predicted CXXCH cytochrome family protein
MLVLGVAVRASFAQERVSQSVHNLSASGPGQVRAASEQQVCIFCHAPHNTSGTRPLWNHQAPLASYRIYESSTLDAKPGQPTGASKLCLSCHDGTVALGAVLSRGDRIRMIGGDFIPAGLTNLGTDLSDDHPVSFFYTSGLAASDRQLATPSSLHETVRLDADGQLQCTACHDPHNNSFGDFLVRSTEFGELCMTCHTMNGWTQCGHRTASAPILSAQSGDWPYATVAENACRSCHRPHNAAGNQRLMIYENEEDNCLDCHDGLVAATNIVAEIDKFSVHDPRRSQGAHDPIEDFTRDRAHVECSDCHNPHATTPVVPADQYVPLGPTMQFVRGVTIGGGTVESATHEYQICFRCHGDTAVTTTRQVQRQSQVNNMRLRFSQGNPSFHPVVVPVASRDTVSLAPNLPSGSMIRCTDCHNNDNGPRAGGSGPDGPHGSSYPFLLERNYAVLDDNPESEFEYAMCYKCHQRTTVLSPQSFPLHRLHVVDERTPCSACHDPHGVSLTQGFGSDHTHLINFDLRIVSPEATTQQINFDDRGRFAGSCTLLCHGFAHVNSSYGLFGASDTPIGGSARRVRRIR